jgi:nicotinamidase-related amidase
MPANDSALLVIDVQKGLDDPKWGQRNNPGAEENIVRLLDAWRKRNAPVFHFQHLSTEPDSPLRPERPGCAIKEEVLPAGGERLMTKQVNSCFIGTKLEAELRAERIENVVLCGLTTDHCVSTTARMAANLGFRVAVVSDATATFERNGPDGTHFSAQQMHDTALASLNGEFATVKTTNELVAD